MFNWTLFRQPCYFNSHTAGFSDQKRTPLKLSKPVGEREDPKQTHFSRLIAAEQISAETNPFPQRVSNGGRR